MGSHINHNNDMKEIIFQMEKKDVGFNGKCAPPSML